MCGYSEVRLANLILRKKYAIQLIKKYSYAYKSKFAKKLNPFKFYKKVCREMKKISSESKNIKCYEIKYSFLDNFLSCFYLFHYNPPLKQTKSLQKKITQKQANKYHM